jgi:hypothetical protein
VAIFTQRIYDTGGTQWVYYRSSGSPDVSPTTTDPPFVGPLDAATHMVLNISTEEGDEATPVQTGVSVSAEFDQVVRCNPSLNPQAVGLPAIAAENEGKQIEVKVVVGASPGSPLPNNVTITPNGGDLIDGAASFVISVQRGAVTLKSDGSSEWMIV